MRSGIQVALAWLRDVIGRTWPRQRLSVRAPAEVKVFLSPF
jgi:hypothetical protein